MARLTPSGLAISTARSTAALAPEITTWPPPLSLAGSTTSSLPVSGSVGAASRRSPRPGRSRRRAARPSRRCPAASPSASPRRAGAAAARRWRGRRRRPRPARCIRPANGRRPAPPCRARAKPALLLQHAQHGEECAISAGWALAVSVSSSAGPSNISFDSFCFRVSSTSWKTSRAAAKAAARSRPMPTAWLPWPGKMKA